MDEVIERTKFNIWWESYWNFEFEPAEVLNETLKHVAWETWKASKEIL